MSPPCASPDRGVVEFNAEDEYEFRRRYDEIGETVRLGLGAFLHIVHVNTRRDG